MARQLKEKSIGARINADFDKEINKYLESEDISMGELIRRSIRHYLWANPVTTKEKGE